MFWRRPPDAVLSLQISYRHRLLLGIRMISSHENLSAYRQSMRTDNPHTIFRQSAGNPRTVLLEIQVPNSNASETGLISSFVAFRTDKDFLQMSFGAAPSWPSSKLRNIALPALHHSLNEWKYYSYAAMFKPFLLSLAFQFTIRKPPPRMWCMQSTFGI